MRLDAFAMNVKSLSKRKKSVNLKNILFGILRAGSFKSELAKISELRI